MIKCYSYLFEDLFEEFKKKSLLFSYYQKIKKIVFVYFAIIIISLIINLCFKLIIYVTIFTNILAYLLIAIINHVFLTNIRKKKNIMVEKFFCELDDLLDSSSFKNINSLSKLNELQNFLIQKRNSTLLSQKSNN